MDEPTIFDPVLHSHLIPQLVKIHQQCITTAPYTIATFLPPLDTSVMTRWWEARVAEAKEGLCTIIVQFAGDGGAVSEEVAGYVMLGFPGSQTGPFRGSVEKLLVSPAHRRKGVAKRLMSKLESVASEKGRVLLLLDTETGSPAELVYPKLGYVLVGIIPDYGISPHDGSLKPETFFYKRLPQVKSTA